METSLGGKFALGKITIKQQIQDRLKEDKLFACGYGKLNDFQIQVLEDCIKQQSGGLSLPMGSGKTLVSIVLGLYQSFDSDSPILVACSKSLVSGWVFEIEKFFPEDDLEELGILDNLDATGRAKFPYEILHMSAMKTPIERWEIKPETRMIITTPDVTAIAYRNCNIEDMFVKKRMPVPPTMINYYEAPTTPFLTHLFGTGYLYSRCWGALIIDEAQKYTNVDTDKCRSLSSICTPNRWVLSGTLFDEPKAERILGYHLLIQLKGVPNTLPETEKLIWSRGYGGLNTSMVHRSKNLAFTNPPKLNEKIISHTLTEEEQKVYIGMRTVLQEVQKRIRSAQIRRDIDGARQFSSYLLAMITYLRQVLICPIIPIASIAIDASDVEQRSELSKIITQEFSKLNIDPWLNDVQSLKSSRIKSVLENLAKHDKERLVLFTCFKSCADVLTHFMPKDRPILRIDAAHTIDKRGKVIEEFKETANGILVLTYQLGAEGLNLQCSYTIFLMDFWWNAAKTQQAVARVLRYGQTSDIVNVYYFTANTGIENAILKKQKSKLKALDELRYGRLETKIPALTMNDILKMINQDDNQNMIQSMGYF